MQPYLALEARCQEVWRLAEERKTRERRELA